MSNLLQWFVLLISLSFTGVVLYMLVNKKINEKNTLVWLGSAVLILIFAVNPGLLTILADFFGVDYPPSLLFLFSVLVLLLLILYQSKQISTLHDKIKELTQYIAIRDCENHGEQQMEQEDA